ncbi:RidA family protein [Massilia endophytica]|uniref:RidA family protein n=1 Tax=Massilia endophytica TaxID=2899220 RepID=UPI001E4FF54C|nr:RidA family protein [Massilia endophytica]UGQ48597.1 RidA family protein [Massilia endophytica]
MKKLLLACAVLAMPLAVKAEEKKCYNMDPAFEHQMGYCQAVRTGNTLYISGTAASGDMPAAIAKVYADLKTTLAAHGLTFADVVKENVYATDLDAFIKHHEIRKAMYTKGYPAATWLQVTRLFTPKLVVEVELVAVFPSK